MLEHTLKQEPLPCHAQRRSTTINDINLLSLVLRNASGRTGRVNANGYLGSTALCDRWGLRVIDGIAVLLCPLGLLGPLLIPPRPSVAELAGTLTHALTAKLLGQILGGYLREQLLLVPASEDVDLGARDRVEELLDDAEDAREAPGRVDDVHLAEALGVVVLRDCRDCLEVAVYGGGFRDTDALQIEDAARCLEEVARLAGAGGKTRVRHLLVLADQVLDHAFLRRDLVERGEVDLAELLDVDWAAVLLLLALEYQRLAIGVLCRSCGSTAGSTRTPAAAPCSQRCAPALRRRHPRTRPATSRCR
jgi:hypothetical protein